MYKLHILFLIFFLYTVPSGALAQMPESKEIQQTYHLLPAQEKEAQRFLQAQTLLLQQQYDSAQQLIQENLQSTQGFQDIWHFLQIQTDLAQRPSPEALKRIQLFLQQEPHSFYKKQLAMLLWKNAQAHSTPKFYYELLHSAMLKPWWNQQKWDLAGVYLKAAQQLQKKPHSHAVLLQWQYPTSMEQAQQTEVHTSPNHSMAMYEARLQSLQNLRAWEFIVEVTPHYMPHLKTPKLKRAYGKAYFKALFYKRQYRKIIQLYHEAPLSKEYNLPVYVQLYWGIRSHLRLKEVAPAQELANHMKKVAPPKSFWLRKAYQNMGEAYHVRKQYSQAQPWWDLLIQTFPKKSDTYDAYWSQSWRYLIENNPQKAIQPLEQALLGMDENTYEQAQFLYWKARFAHQLKDQPKAQKALNQLQQYWPNSFYTYLLTHEPETLKPLISKLPPLSEKQKRFWQEPTGSLSEVQQQKLARYRFLLRIEQKELAAYEATQDAKSSKNARFTYEIALLLEQTQQYDLLMEVVQKFYVWYSNKYQQDEQPLWRWFYPRPFWNLIQEKSLEAGIDPYLALAIIREESRFDADALSRTRAHGLMQLMPATARDLASRQNMPLDDLTQLFEPEYNLSLGIAYLGQLMKQFDGEMAHAIGAYNGGAGNMKKWIKRWEHLSKVEFMERVPFLETRKYIKRVLRSYYAYQRIYGTSQGNP